MISSKLSSKRWEGTTTQTLVVAALIKLKKILGSMVREAVAKMQITKIVTIE